MTVLSADWLLPVEGAPIRDGAIAFEDGRIAAVGTVDELGAGERHEGCAILPGLVNAHSHLEYAVYAGFADGQPFAPWLATHIERKERIGLAEMEAIARLGAAESLASGVTTVGDCSFSGAAATACADLGMRATVYLEVFGFDLREARYAELRERLGELPDRVRIGVSPHAPYTCDLELYAACAELGVPVATHLAESEAEAEWARAGAGPIAGVRPTSIRELADAGLLGPHVVGAHCVHVDAEEIELLARHGVGVAHCPRSNALLGCGVAPLAELLAAGVRVGIGSDSPASTPSFDQFEELRAAVYAARARERDPSALTAETALELATLGSARALGLDREIGSLAPGKRADLLVLDLSGSAFLPWEDPATAVVLGGTPERVAAVYVDGEARYERGSFEWHEVRSTSASARRRLLGPSGSPRAQTPAGPAA